MNVIILGSGGRISAYVNAVFHLSGFMGRYNTKAGDLRAKESMENKGGKADDKADEIFSGGRAPQELYGSRRGMFHFTVGNLAADPGIRA